MLTLGRNVGWGKGLALLGFISLGLVAAARGRWTQRDSPRVASLGLAVLLVLACLARLSGLLVPWVLPEVGTLSFTLLAAPLPALLVRCGLAGAQFE